MPRQIQDATHSNTMTANGPHHQLKPRAICHNSPSLKHVHVTPFVYTQANMYRFNQQSTESIRAK